jgi:hypothetical protein
VLDPRALQRAQLKLDRALLAPLDAIAVVDDEDAWSDASTLPA